MSKPEDAGATGDHGVEKIGAADATEGASPASGPAALASMPPSMTLSTESLTERQIIVPFMEHSTRYAVL